MSRLPLADTEAFLREIASPDAQIRATAWRFAARQGAPAVAGLADLMASSASPGVTKAARGALESIAHHAARPFAPFAERHAVAAQLLLVAEDARRPRAVRAHALHLLGFVGGRDEEPRLAALVAAGPGYAASTAAAADDAAVIADEARMARERIAGARRRASAVAAVGDPARRPPVVGAGSHRYEPVAGWARLPDRIKLGYTHGVVVDARDNVYVHNQSKDAVVVFDRDGTFLSSWGEEFAAGAHGMFLSRETGGREYLYLSDYVRHTVVKTTLDGKIVWRLGVPDLPAVYPSADAYRPTDVAVAPNGDFYVCDGYGQHWIHQYDARAKHVRSWGGRGSEPGKMNCPHGIWVDTRRPGTAPRLLVADRENHRIQVFSLDGQHVGFAADRGELRRPCCFYQSGGELYIPDLHGRVTILGRDDRVLAHVGDDPGIWERPGWPNLAAPERRPGRFISPHAACVDSRGDLYVAEWVSDGRITKLRRVNGAG